MFATVDNVSKRPRPELAAALRAARKKVGLSQYQLADKAGLSRQTIAAIETGIPTTVKLSTLRALAAALGVPVETLAEPAQSAAAAPYVARFLQSDWAKVAKPTSGEIEWLQSLPTLTWLGDEPTDETFYHMLEALRARASKH